MKYELDNYEELSDQLMSLVKNKEDYYRKVNYGYTLLHLAAEHNAKDIVEQILEQDLIDIDNQDNHIKDTPLHVALYHSCTDIAKLLIRKGANVNLKNFFYKVPLHEASYLGYFDIVQMLLDKGANIDEKSSRGYTSLCIANSQGHDEVAKILSFRKKQK